MIEEIKDISKIEKLKFEKRHNLFENLSKCLFPLIFAVVGMTLFSLYMTGNFVESFRGENVLTTVGRFFSNLLLLSILFLGVNSHSRVTKTTVRDFWLTVLLCVFTYMICLATAGYFNVYAMPIMLVTLVLAVLIDRKIATIATATVAVMLVMAYLFNPDFAKFTVGEAVSSVVCNTLGAIIINFFVDKHFARLKFLIFAMLTAIFALPFVVTSTLASGDFSINILWNTLWSYGASVLAIFVFMTVVAICEGVFNIADDFRLNELCNLNNPLLKRLASEAPGTFNHSLVVGNLAEACASVIGENPHLARCAAYYHDVGKLKAPVYFSENQSTYNPHDELIPEVSVSMITAHTLFGEILAKKYRLPQEIVAVCREHHGTAPVGYFYRKAKTLKEEGDIAIENYKYSGPKPQTKISAIIMISDTIEAALRANMPEIREEFEARVNKLVDEKMQLRQFDECPITMHDISLIKQTIMEVLPSIHHSRVSYEKTK